LSTSSWASIVFWLTRWYIPQRYTCIVERCFPAHEHEIEKEVWCSKDKYQYYVAFFCTLLHKSRMSVLFHMLLLRPVLFPLLSDVYFWLSYLWYIWWLMMILLFDWMFYFSVNYSIDSSIFAIRLYLHIPVPHLRDNSLKTVLFEMRCLG